MRLHTAAWVMCRIRGVRLKQCAFNCSWLYWGTPRGMLSDANPLMPYRCDVPAICGRSFSSAQPEVGSTFLLLFWSQFTVSSLDRSWCVIVHPSRRFPTLPITYIRFYSGKNIMQYLLCSGACLLFDLANTWEAFYKWIISHRIHNVLIEIIKMPAQGHKSKVLTSKLKMSVWKTLGAVGTWKLQRRAASYGMPLARSAWSREVSFLFVPPRFEFIASSWLSSGQHAALTGEAIKRLTCKTTVINLRAERNETVNPRGAFVYFSAAWL